MESEDYYSYLRGRWLDGKPIVAGCDGYHCAGAKTTTYMYNGNPLDNKTWHERSAGNRPGDRRGLGSTGPLTLNAGDKHTFEFAYVTTFKQAGSTDANLDAMYDDISKIKTYYNNNLNTGTPESNNIPKQLIEFAAYPNPANDVLNLEWNNSSAETVRIMNMLGQTVWSKNISAGESKISIDTKHFPRGVYMVVADNGLQKAVTRVVLQ